MPTIPIRNSAHRPSLTFIQLLQDFIPYESLLDASSTSQIQASHVGYSHMACSDSMDWSYCHFVTRPMERLVTLPEVDVATPIVPSRPALQSELMVAVSLLLRCLWRFLV